MDAPAAAPVPDLPVAAAAAPPLAAWRESGNGVIEIPDVDADVMRHFLLYLYGARVPEEMDEQLAEELLIVADKYDVDCLKLACEKALGEWAGVASCVFPSVFCS